MADEKTETQEEYVARIWSGPDGLREAQERAIEAMSSGPHVNRFFVFEVDGLFEMAFGNFRAMRVSDGEVITNVQFPVGVKMDRSMAISLKDYLVEMLPDGEAAEDKEDG
ncbi:hypothetical protein [Nisaea sp.]|uniref:hypothetical protein n=1 Tax=Nisaea sp. TaxID=2024842 RepID=UPI002B26BA88|nr:hypothetical protein [Nisaea sp.]